MLVINGVLATEEDKQDFYSWLVQGKIIIDHIKVGSTYTNVITKN